MIKKVKFPKVFLGWWVNIATAVATGIADIFYMQGASALLKPIAADLRLSRAAASVATGVGALQQGVGFALAGWLSDRFGPKWVAVSGVCIMSTGLLLMNFIDSAWAYYVVWGLMIGAGHSLGFTVAIDTMLTNWFVRKRGRAFSVRFTITGILGVILMTLIGWLIATQGWRATCLVWAGLVFACIPLALYFVKQRRPEYYGFLPDGATVEPGLEADRDAMIARGLEYAAGYQETEFSLRQAMRTPAFWMLTITWVIHGAALRGINIHIIPFLTDMGIDTVIAASMMAMMVFFTIPSRILGGLIADRVRKEHLKFLQAMTYVLPAIGITAFLLSPSVAMVYILLILYGFGNGAFLPLDIMMRSRYFGRKAYGSIQGTSMVLSAPVSFFAPIFSGWVYDTTGNYTNAFILAVALLALGALIMFLIRVPKPPDTAVTNCLEVSW